MLRGIKKVDVLIYGLYNTIKNVQKFKREFQIARKLINHITRIQLVRYIIAYYPKAQIRFLTSKAEHI